MPARLFWRGRFTDAFKSNHPNCTQHLLDTVGAGSQPLGHWCLSQFHIQWHHLGAERSMPRSTYITGIGKQDLCIISWHSTQTVLLQATTSVCLHHCHFPNWSPWLLSWITRFLSPTATGFYPLKIAWHFQPASGTQHFLRNKVQKTVCHLCFLNTIVSAYTFLTVISSCIPLTSNIPTLTLLSRPLSWEVPFQTPP